MLYNANCKINLGLYVLSKRDDGYHNISTIMIPVSGLYDIVEIVKNDSDDCIFSSSGLSVDCSDSNNLCVKAYKIVKEEYPEIGGVNIHLHKIVPFGAGLGGGSSDAVAVIKLLNRLFNLNMSKENMVHLAIKLGSDTAFFVYNTPMLCEGRGELMTPVDIDISQYKIGIVKPNISVNTACAYKNIAPSDNRDKLTDIVKNSDINKWRDTLINDFEKSMCIQNQEVVSEIKNKLYLSGAKYVSLSGSGSAFYGIFDNNTDIGSLFPKHFTFM